MVLMSSRRHLAAVSASTRGMAWRDVGWRAETMAPGSACGGRRLIPKELALLLWVSLMVGEKAVLENAWLL